MEEGKELRISSPTMRRLSAEILKFTAQRGMEIDKLADAMGWSKYALLRALTPEGGLAISSIDRILEILDAEIVVRLHPRQKLSKGFAEEEDKLVSAEEQKAKDRLKRIKHLNAAKRYRVRRSVVLHDISPIELQGLLDRISAKEEKLDEIDKERFRLCMQRAGNNELTIKWLDWLREMDRKI